MLVSECQRNNNRNQNVPHPQPAGRRVVVVADIVVDADVVAASGHP